MEDSKIIELYWARDEAAIVQTDAVYGRKLKTLAHKILNDLEDAEESVNDTYMKTWETIPPQKPNYFYAFIAAICRNLSLHKVDWNRASKRSAVVVTLTDEMALCIPDAAVEREMEAKEIGKALNAFLESLPSETRLIFMRRYWHMDTIEEIAQQYLRYPPGVDQIIFLVLSKIANGDPLANPQLLQKVVNLDFYILHMVSLSIYERMFVYDYRAFGNILSSVFFWNHTRLAGLFICYNPTAGDRRTAFSKMSSLLL